MEVKAMKILVIGNGFDIAHGLNTTYSDFLEFIRNYKRHGVINQEFMDIISNNVWINYFDSIYEERKREGKDGWIDFESEISTVIEALDLALLSYYRLIEKPERKSTRVIMDQSAFEILNKVLKFEEGRGYG